VETQEERNSQRTKLLERCQLVFSAPAVAFLGGDLAVLVGGWAVGQALPLRVYVGLELRSHGKQSVEFDCRAWDYRNYKYVEETLLHEKPIADLIQLFHLKDKAIFHILSDYPAKMGGAWAGAVSAALAATLLNRRDASDLAEIRGWPNFGANQLLQDANFRRCFELALKLEGGIHGKSSGGGAFCSMVGSSYPVWFRRLDCPAALKGTPEAPPNYEGGTTVETLSALASETVDVELGLVSSGAPRDTADVLRAAMRRLEHNKDILVQNSKNIYEAVCKVLESPEARDPIDRLIREMNFARSLFDYLDLGWHSADQIVATWIHTMLELHLRGEVGLKPTGSGSGGFMLSIAPASMGEFHEKVSEALSRGPKPDEQSPAWQTGILWHGTFPVEAHGLHVEPWTQATETLVMAAKENFPSCDSDVAFRSSSELTPRAATTAAPKEDVTQSANPIHERHENKQNLEPAAPQLKEMRMKMLAMAQERWRSTVTSEIPFELICKAAKVDHKDGYNWRNGKLPSASVMTLRIEKVLQDPKPPIHRKSPID